ncbi:hypothetical protein CDAR_428851 [Caerostris darwini]|uniref:Uncharacterized protein n=1 Tax=Caerostris darwini TaxID=1538125 RepID=A0AAV4V4C5_9ARAC|nr:hypothetical protein CDAR_428851 [Caerostris darwini]
MGYARDEILSYVLMKYSWNITDDKFSWQFDISRNLTTFEAQNSPRDYRRRNHLNLQFSTSSNLVVLVYG